MYSIIFFADHKRDPARAEDALALSFGTELIGMQRDWNEELQSCREFPHKTLQERFVFIIVYVIRFELFPDFFVTFRCPTSFVGLLLRTVFPRSRITSYSFLT